MTANQLMLLLAIYVGVEYGKWLHKDLRYLNDAGYVEGEEVTEKGYAYIDSALNIKVRQIYEAYL